MTTQTKIPLWQVRAFVISDDEHSDEYLDGKKTPGRIISSGYLCVHGQKRNEARERAERILRETYNGVIEIDFLNTKRLCEGKYFTEGFEGLELVN